MDVDERLIEFVKENPLLYDKRNANYKKNEKKAEKWKEIGEKLNITEEAVKKRWRTIKDRYNRLKKESNLPSGSGAKGREKNYKFSELLSFLNETPTTNERTTSNYPSTSATIRCDQFVEDATINADKFVEDMFEEDDIIVNEEVELSNTEMNDFSNITSSSGGSASRQSKRRQLVDEVLIANTNKELLNLMSSLKEECKSKSKEWTFCESLAVQLEEANLPSDRFMSFQIKVLQILQEERNLNKMNAPSTSFEKFSFS